MEKETKKQTIKMTPAYLGAAILLILIASGTASATYAGECMEVNLGELENNGNIVYMTIGNSSNMNGMNVSLNSETKNASICFEVNYKPDNFTLIFFDEVTREIIKEVHNGGGNSGGSSTKYIKENVTVIQPLFLDRVINNETIKEVEVEKIIYKYDSEGGSKLWHILLAMVLGAGLLWLGLWLFYREEQEALE